MPSHAKSGLARSRAPTAFSVRIKSIRTENSGKVKNKDGVGFYTRPPIAQHRNSATTGGAI
jgi:hypothetical protein